MGSPFSLMDMLSVFPVTEECVNGMRGLPENNELKIILDV